MSDKISSGLLGSLILVPVALLALIVFVAIKCSRCSLDWWKQHYRRTGLFSWRKPKGRTTGSSADSAKVETVVELDQLPPAHLQV